LAAFVTRSEPGNQTAARCYVIERQPQEDDRWRRRAGDDLGSGGADEGLRGFYQRASSGLGHLGGDSRSPPYRDPAGYGRDSLPLINPNCTVFLTEVVGFGSDTRTDADRSLIREALFKMTEAAVEGMPNARIEGRGDGF
jgi:hypothetical protein